MLTLVASALAGGDCIDDADVLRTGRTAGTLGCVVKAPSRRSCAASDGATSANWIGSAASCWPGPGRLGPDPATRHSPSTWIRRSARHTVWPRRGRATTATRARGAITRCWLAAGTGDVLMARLREGRANTARGAAHFLRETVGRVRYAGARGQLTVRADSGFYTHAIVAACRRMDVRYSITIRRSASLRNLIEAIPEQDWTPIPYWMEGAADVAETSYTPFQSGPDAAPVRLIVPEAHARFPVGPLRHLQLSRLHHRPGGGNPGTGGRPSAPRRDQNVSAAASESSSSRTPSETSSTAWGSTISPQPTSPPTAPGSRCR